jgi:hypothetical protein
MVKTKAPYNYDKPCRELAAAVGSIRAQSIEVVSVQPVENECVAVHDIVVISAQRASDIENELAVGLNEQGPRFVASGRLELLEQLGQLVQDRFGH